MVKACGKELEVSLTWTWGPPEAPSASMVYSALGWFQQMYE